MDIYVVHSYHLLSFFCKVPKRDVEMNGNVDNDLASLDCLPT